MPQTQIACPQCRQPIQANIEQLIDVTNDPGAKQRLLGGAVNVASCPICGFQGRVATPIVYHDNEKELLLTFFPPELNTPLTEQEKVLGPLIKRVTDRLPAEKRKAYLFNPQANLTYESMIETILGKDGVTPEMIKEQKERVAVIERLIQASSPEIRSEIIKQNPELIDEQFFTLFGRLAQGAAGSGQESIKNQMIDIQNQLLEETEFGHGLQESVQELETASKTLQEAGERLTREKLLELVIEAPNDARVRAYVSLARGGMDYVFFQNLTEKIDAASGEEKTRLESLRTSLLDFTNEIDRQLEERIKGAQAFLDNLLEQDDVEKATHDNLNKFTQDAVDLVQTMLRQASDKNDYARMGKLQKIIEVLQEASAPPPEVAFIEELLAAPDEAAMEKMLTENEESVNEDFISTMGGLLAQIESTGQSNPEAKAIAEKLENLYKIALRISMKKQMEA